MADEINNQTVVLTLVAAIVISLGGTVVVLTKLSSMGPATGITGFVTSNATGQVQIEIPTALEISVTNTTIDFGTCELPTARVNISSAMTGVEINETNVTNCTGGNTGAGADGFPRWISIVNTGNVAANLSVESDLTGTQMLGDGAFAYKMDNGAASTGCDAVNLTTAWTEFTTADERQVICSQLKYGGGTNKVRFYANVSMSPFSTTGGAQQTATLTFHGRSMV